jgi:hypothetical protein
MTFQMVQATSDRHVTAYESHRTFITPEPLEVSSLTSPWVDPDAINNSHLDTTTPLRQH